MNTTDKGQTLTPSSITALAIRARELVQSDGTFPPKPTNQELRAMPMAERARVNREYREASNVYSALLDWVQPTFHKILGRYSELDSAELEAHLMEQFTSKVFTDFDVDRSRDFEPFAKMRLAGRARDFWAKANVVSCREVRQEDVAEDEMPTFHPSAEQIVLQESVQRAVARVFATLTARGQFIATNHVLAPKDERLEGTEVQAALGISRQEFRTSKAKVQRTFQEALETAELRYVD